jgi:hypothetical protein
MGIAEDNQVCHGAVERNGKCSVTLQTLSKQGGEGMPVLYACLAPACLPGNRCCFPPSLCPTLAHLTVPAPWLAAHSACAWWQRLLSSLSGCHIHSRPLLHSSCHEAAWRHEENTGCQCRIHAVLSCLNPEQVHSTCSMSYSQPPPPCLSAYMVPTKAGEHQAQAKQIALPYLCIPLLHE